MIVVMSAVSYGYCHHVMDCPGTINVSPATFVGLLLVITRSVAYHGFKRIILINGHGSNHHLVEQAGRQTNLQTDALCCTLSWWQLVAGYWNDGVRESGPGGCAHACELETSVYLHLDEAGVRPDRITRSQQYTLHTTHATYTIHPLPHPFHGKMSSSPSRDR